MSVKLETIKKHSNLHWVYKDHEITIELKRETTESKMNIIVNYKGLHYVLPNALDGNRHFQAIVSAVKAVRQGFLWDVIGIPDQWEVYSDDDWKELQREPHEAFVRNLVAGEDYYLLWTDPSKIDAVYTLDIQHIYGGGQDAFIFTNNNDRRIFTYESLIDALVNGELTIDRPA